MKKTLSIVTLILIFSFSANSQIVKSIIGNPWTKGEIVMTKGVKKGFVKAPAVPNVKTVKYKTNENANEEEIPSSEIKEVRIFNTNGEVSILENTKINPIGGKYGKKHPKVSKKPAFILRIATGYFNAYISAYNVSYNVNKEGYIKIVTRGYAENGICFNYYIKEEGKDFANLVYESTFLKAQKKQFIKLWLGDCPAVVEKLNDRKFFKNADLGTFVNIYNKNK